jgi:hypothetical protein
MVFQGDAGAHRGGQKNCLKTTRKQTPEDIFRANGDQLRMSEAIARGISRYMLYALRDRGVIEQLSRGVYRLVELPPIGNPDLVTVALRVPNAVVCLISALAFHEISTQIPHGVSVAIPPQARRPALVQPPLAVHRFSGASYLAGGEEHRIDGVSVNAYSPEKPSPTISNSETRSAWTWCWKPSNSTKPESPSNLQPSSTMRKSTGYRT